MSSKVATFSVIALLFFTVFLPFGSISGPNPNDVQVPDEVPCESPCEIKQEVIIVTDLFKISIIQSISFHTQQIGWPVQINLVSQFTPLDLHRPPVTA